MDAFQKIKKNKGSKTPGIDGITIGDFERQHKDDLVEYIRRKIIDYHPKPVRRKMIPKRNGKFRPLGIPCIEDRIIQQCIKQVIEPICEAKFHKHSYGFRENRSADHAMGRLYSLGGIYKLSYAIVMDIESFFDNVDHTKLLKQLWHIGIQDRTIIKIINKMLKCGVYDPETKKIIATKSGTPQGGIISPLLANVVLNELDWFVSNQWETAKLHRKYSSLSSRYGALYKTKRIKQFIVRYADDFVIMTNTRSNANKIYKITKHFIEDNLHLKINDYKSSIINLKKKNLEFLGFRYKLVKTRNEYTSRSHITKSAGKRIYKTLRNALKQIKNNRTHNTAKLYNMKVRGIINYYNMATMINYDLCQIYYKLQRILKLITEGQPARYDYSKSYGKLYPQLNYRTYWILDICLYPLYANFRIPMNYREKDVTDKFKKNCQILLNNIVDEWSYLRYLVYKRDKGICKYTNVEVDLDSMDIHHIIPKHLGGEDTIKNLVLVSREYHQQNFKELHGY